MSASAEAVVRERELEEVKRSWAADADSTIPELERAVAEVLEAPWVRTTGGVDWSAFFLV